MYVQFEEMPSHARVWVYQANRVLNELEVATLQEMLKQFAENWDSHGKNLHASFLLQHDQFIIIAVDQESSMPSGCAIDKSVALLRNAGERFDVDFFDRTNVAFRKEPKINMLKMKDIRHKIDNGELTPDTVIFNTLVESKEQLESQWEVPAKKSWLARYFK